MIHKLAVDQRVALKEYADKISDGLPDGWVNYEREQYGTVAFSIELPGQPATADTCEYMDTEYLALFPYAVPGIVHVEGYDAAVDFLNTLREGPTVDWKKCMAVYHTAHIQAWWDAVSTFLGDVDVDENGVPVIPTEGDGVPWWPDELRDFQHADAVTTVGYTDAHGTYSSIEPPEDEGCLPFWYYFDHNEGKEVDINYVLEAQKLNPLEELLALGMLYTSDSFGTTYAYVQTEVVGACWLRPVPENLEYLEATVQSEAFDRYYTTYNEDGEDDHPIAIAAFLDRVERALGEWHYHEDELAEYQEEIEQARRDYLGGEQ